LFLIWRQWPTIVTEADKRNLWSQLWTAIPLMLVETLAWGTLAYVAALLITQMEADRRRLVSVNAELLSSRAMLAESSRAAERLDIARELHDSLGHHLTTLNLELELSHRVPAPEKEGHVKQAQFLARLLLADLRETVSSWRLPHTTGLPQALAALATGINTVNVQVDIDPALPAIDAPRSHALLRCAQEAVTNALRHSAANRIDVSLAPHETGIVLRVADNGYGCPLPALGNGLNGIRERAESFAGHARFESLPAGGFLVEVILP
jgi:signal transduction histidine kinase